MRGNEKQCSDSPCVTAHTNPGHMLNEPVYCRRQKDGPTDVTRSSWHKSARTNESM